MGLFDSFVGRCPRCGEEIEVQTKMFEPHQRVWKPGDVMEDLGEDIISMKFKTDGTDNCPKCGYVPVIMIDDRRFLGFIWEDSK